MLDPRLQWPRHLAQLLHGPYVLHIDAILVHEQEIVDHLAAGQYYGARLLHGVRQNFSNLLGNDSRVNDLGHSAVVMFGLLSAAAVRFRRLVHVRHYRQSAVDSELRLVAILNDTYTFHVLQLLRGVQLADLPLRAAVARLHDASRYLQVAVHHQTLVGPVGVDADAARVENRVLGDASLPAQLHVVLELARIRRLRARDMLWLDRLPTRSGGKFVITHPNDDALAALADDWEIAGVRVRVEADDELKVALLGVRAALLPHVVARRLGKVQPAHRHLAHLTIL